MKKTIYILIFFVITNYSLLIDNCFCQWSQVNLPVTSTIQKVQFVNQNTGWINLYNGNLLKSTNGGINWNVIVDTSYHLFGFQFVNDTLGYGMGVWGVNNLLLKTINGGYNWTVMQSSSSFMLSGFYFVNADTGYFNAFVVSNYNTYRTTNGLQSYELISNEAGGSPAKMFFVKEPYNGNLYGYMQGAGHLWKTTNSGYNWTQLSFSGIVYGFSFINKDTGWVDLNFENSVVYKTTNAGENWTMQFQANRLANIFAINSNKIYCGADHSYIQVSTNGGAEWGKQYSPLSSNYNVYMYDTSLGFAWSGIQMVRTTNGGGQINSIQKISENVPNNYELKQNYPNPFNPSTNIEFKISSSATVYLQVFDILGRNVADIINSKEYSSGTYRVKFDMGEMNLSGGVYFYKLTVYQKDGNKIFTSTKKMLLIK